MEMQIEDLTLR